MIKEPWLPVHPDLKKLERDANEMLEGVTPIGRGKRFHNRMVVSEPAMEIIAAHGGAE